MNYKKKYSYTYIDQWVQFIKYNKQINPSVDYKKSILITGPCGIGKTTCLYKVLSAHNYNITEFNLLDFKNHSEIKKQISNILHYKNIHSLFTNTNNNNIIIFNEIDKISVSDRSIINNIIKYIRSSTPNNKKYVPIIFKGNNYSSFFKKITEVAMYLKFPLPSENDKFLFCKDYIHTNNISITDVQIQCFIEYLPYNYRSIKNNLDVIFFYIKKNKTFSLENIKLLIKDNQNDLDVDIYQGVYELLTSKLEPETCQHIMSKDTKYILLLLHKNILSYVQYNTKNTSLNKLHRIEDIYTYMNYSTLILHYFNNVNKLFLYNYINSTVSVLCNSIVNNKKNRLEYGKFSIIHKSPIYSKLNYKFCNLKYIKILTNKLNINDYNFQLFSHYLYYIINKYKIKKYAVVAKHFIDTHALQSKELDKIFKLNYLHKNNIKKKNYSKIYKELLNKQKKTKKTKKTKKNKKIN